MRHLTLNFSFFPNLISISPFFLILPCHPSLLTFPFYPSLPLSTFSAFLLFDLPNLFFPSSVNLTSPLFSSFHYQFSPYPFPPFLSSLFSSSLYCSFNFTLPFSPFLSYFLFTFSLRLSLSSFLTSFLSFSFPDLFFLFSSPHFVSCLIFPVYAKKRT